MLQLDRHHVNMDTTLTALAVDAREAITTPTAVGVDSVHACATVLTRVRRTLVLICVDNSNASIIYI